MYGEGGGFWVSLPSALPSIFKVAQAAMSRWKSISANPACSVIDRNVPRRISFRPIGTMTVRLEVPTLRNFACESR